MRNKLINEYRVFLSYPHNMRVLLITNLIYSLVLPIIELFIGAYIMRNSQEAKLVVIFQLALYTGIPITFAINGFLLRKIKIAWLYAFGMLLSGVSMTAMMMLSELNITGIAVAGLIMGISYGFFWANRDYLALETTNDQNRNYYYGLETFFYTLTSVIVPYFVGVFIGATKENHWFEGNINTAYQIITAVVFILTIISSIYVHKGKFINPKQEKFIFFRFHRLWNKMIGLSILKGLAQGYIVTAPAMLIMKLVGDEHVLGTVQAIGAIMSALMLYVLGRISKPQHRIYIFSIGLIIFALGSFINAGLYSSMGVIMFMLCLVVARPLLDVAYFPIQLKVIDLVAEFENRNEFAYFLHHEFGLYIGRLLGCGMFIAMTYFITEDFALKYALLIIACIQLFSIFVAKNIIKNSKKL
ncbi:MFS transporter [Prolixibacteraceae bacterium Z1-6]|uniref:MFS transporter n=1 Tax=Draconibacterium aestuarii TaxID=2998507 RepID=A0A9X3F7M0_9BACT|nr:MFS transporter [Prolixibacteraceae bacterium Z1-6]